MKNTKRVSQEEFKNVMLSKDVNRGANMIAFDALTDVKLKGGKSNPQQGQVQKLHTDFSGIIFSNKNSSAYGNMINRRLEKDGKDANFVPGRLPWGTRIEGTAVIEHKGNYYIQVIYNQKAVNLLDKAKEMNIELTENDKVLIEQMKQKVVGYETRNGNVEYLLNNEKVEKSEIVGLPEKKSSGKQGGLSDEKKVIVRTFKLSSLKNVRVNGTKYIIED